MVVVVVVLCCKRGIFSCCQLEFFVFVFLFCEEKMGEKREREETRGTFLEPGSGVGPSFFLSREETKTPKNQRKNKKMITEKKMCENINKIKFPNPKNKEKPTTLSIEKNPLLVKNDLKYVISISKKAFFSFFFPKPSFHKQFFLNNVSLFSLPSTPFSPPFPSPPSLSSLLSHSPPPLLPQNKRRKKKIKNKKTLFEKKKEK